MSQLSSLREIPELPGEIVQAGLDGELVLFIGSGVSMLLDLPSWDDLASQSLTFLRKKRFLDFFEIEQMKSLDPKKRLSIARLIAEEEKVALDLTECFRGTEEGNSIYKTINDIGCVCVTTNYDELLTPRFFDLDEDPIKSILVKSKPVKAQPVKRICDKSGFLAKCLDEPGTVVHLHGAISQAETMIVTTREYIEHYGDENVEHFLRELFTKKIVLFIGYGLEEAEILEHILRSGNTESTKDRRRFALQGYFSHQKRLYEYLHKYYEKSFGVHIIGFIRDFENYHQQETIMKTWAPKIKVKKPPLVHDINLIKEVTGRD